MSSAEDSGVALAQSGTAGLAAVSVMPSEAEDDVPDMMLEGVLDREKDAARLVRRSEPGRPPLSLTPCADLPKLSFRPSPSPPGESALLEFVKDGMLDRGPCPEDLELDRERPDEEREREADIGTLLSYAERGCGGEIAERDGRDVYGAWCRGRDRGFGRMMSSEGGCEGWSMVAIAADMED